MTELRDRRLFCKRSTLGKLSLITPTMPFVILLNCKLPSWQGFVINIPSVVGIYEENCQGSRPFFNHFTDLSVLCPTIMIGKFITWTNTLQQETTWRRKNRTQIFFTTWFSFKLRSTTVNWSRPSSGRQEIWNKMLLGLHLLGWTIYLVKREIKKLKVWQVCHLQKVVRAVFTNVLPFLWGGIKDVSL